MIVKLPDGKTAKFPDSMSPQQVESVLAQQYSQAGSTSTITGQPIPTGEEKISQSNEAIRTMGPIIGDLAMTAVAPQLSIAKGAGTGARLGLGALNALIRSMAAGAGGGAGDIVAQKLTGGGPVDMQSAGVQAATGAGAELGMSGAAGLVKTAFKPIRKVLSITPGMKRTFEEITKVHKAAQKKFEQKTTQRAVDFIDGMKAGPEKETAGIRINEILSDKKDFGEVYKEYNALIDKATDSNGEVLLDDFAQEIGDLVQNEMTKRGNKNWAQALNEVKARLSLDTKSANIINDLFAQSEKISTKDAKYLIAKLKGNYKTDSDGLIKLKDKLQKTALGDIGRQSQTGEAAVLAREKATEIYKETQQWFRDNQLADTITKRNWSGGYSVDRIFNASPDEALSIKNAIAKTADGKKAWAGAEFSFIKDLFDRSIQQAGDTGKKRLLPDKLADEIYAKEEFIKTVMPDMWKKLKAEADYYKEIAPQFETLDIGDVWGESSAWDIISPKSKKLVNELLGMSKMGVKAVSQGMARSINKGESK